MSKPLAVITGDCHFTLNTLEEATAVVKQMQEKALELKVPLILNGDTLDSKAIVRAEIMNRLISLFNRRDIGAVLNVGNHDMINEKGSEHSLGFLSPYVGVLDKPMYSPNLDSWLIPYQTSSEALLDILTTVPKGSRIILHQGIQTAFMGHYSQDKTSLPPEAFKDFRVIASHYHRRQDIQCGPRRENLVGTFSYLGNPYSLNFGEVEDGEKGFSVLYDDGSLEFIPTNLRRHRVIEVVYDSLREVKVSPNDLLWLKVSGPKSELDKLDKVEIGEYILGHSNYKLEKCYFDTPLVTKPTKKVTNFELFDSLIDSLDETLEEKEYLKTTWRGLL